MLPGQKYTPEDIIKIVRRRKWLLLLPLVVGTAAGVMVAGRVTELYKSETLIMVVPQRVPNDLVKRTDITKIEDRLPSISEQIQTRSRLERIITDFNLYPEERARGVMEDIVARMRSQINVKLEGKTQEAFRVTYVNADPVLAQKVTERLASWYIEENLRDKERFAENTTQFLDSELENAKRQLMEHERKLEDYRRRYSGQLPSQLETNLQSMQNTQLQLQTVGDALNRASERRLLFERQLSDAQTTPVSVMPDPAMAATQEPSQLTAGQQLEVAQAALARARLRYTPEHPDIRTLERNIAELQVKADEEGKRQGKPVAKTVSPAEALRQKRIREYEAELEVIDRQVVVAKAEQTRLQQLMTDYQAKVDAVPSRESELVELTRDYTTLQTAYTSLLTKRQDAKLAANLESRNIGEQFKVLDPASLPQRPMNPMARLQVLAGGSVGGLVLGLLIVGLLEFRDSTFKTEADVVRVLSLRVLALVPVMTPPAPPQRRRRVALGAPLGRPQP